MIGCLKLSHIGEDKINKPEKTVLRSLNLDLFPVYKSCLRRKMTRSSFMGHGERATKILIPVHIDMYNSFNMQARNGYRLAMKAPFVFSLLLILINYKLIIPRSSGNMKSFHGHLLLSIVLGQGSRPSMASRVLKSKRAMTLVRHSLVPRPIRGSKPWSTWWFRGREADLIEIFLLDRFIISMDVKRGTCSTGITARASFVHLFLALLI